MALRRNKAYYIREHNLLGAYVDRPFTSDGTCTPGEFPTLELLYEILKRPRRDPDTNPRNSGPTYVNCVETYVTFHDFPNLNAFLFF